MLSCIYLFQTPNTEEEWRKIAADFETRWQFPNCIGAIDGKHITIQAVPNSGSLYYNYKGFNSIVLMAIVDANYKFIYVDIGVNGRISDGGVFDSCEFSKKLSSQLNILNIPEQTCLPGTNVKVPYYLVADEAFPLTSHIMKPYPQRNLTHSKRIFNYRLSRARRIVENAFGILSSRFQILRSAIRVHPDKVYVIVLTVCLLHNFLRSDGRGRNSHDEYTCADLNSLELSVAANASGQSARSTRDAICDYVNDQGAVPWQEDKV